jgi:hypothetical protein
MRFETRQRLNGTPDEVERALFDDRYIDFLIKHHGVLIEAKLLEKKDEGGKIKRRVRYLPRPVIKSVGPKEVPPEWFAFVENSTWDKSRKELSFQNVPASQKIDKLLVNTGVLKLRDAGGGQTERVMEGEITLKLGFLLKPLAMIGEKLIQHEGLKILDAEVPVMNKFIAEVLRAG